MPIAAVAAFSALTRMKYSIERQLPWPTHHLCAIWLGS
jgi:hypothetical protein